MKCTIQIFLDDRWQTAAVFEPDPQTLDRGIVGGGRLQYDTDYAIDHLGEKAAELVPGLPVGFELFRFDQWPPFLVDVMPAGAGRRAWLRRMQVERDGPHADWHLLTRGAGSPPGHLRIAEAVRPPPPDHFKIGFPRQDIIEQGERFLDYAEERGAHVAGASSVQGEAPKYLLVEDHAGMFHAEGALTDDRIKAFWLVKFPRGRRSEARNEQVLRNEAPYLEVARHFGIRTGNPLRYDQGALFVPRFDRRVADGARMKQAIRDFGNRLSASDIRLFYYAGHGMQVNGFNYLIPVGSDIGTEDEVEFESVEANRILAKMRRIKGGVNIVLLDACRNNPFARSFRSSERGLARMDAPTGSFIGYATSPGDVASDGQGKNGVFTKHLLLNIERENVPMDDIMRHVRKGVAIETGYKQVPWASSSLLDEIYLNGGPGLPQTLTAQPAEVAALSPSPSSKLSVQMPDSPSALPTRGLVAYYPLDGDFKDHSGNGYDGAMEGKLSFKEGISGKAPIFPGGLNRVRLPEYPETWENGVTLCAWVQFSSAYNASSNDVFVVLSNGSHTEAFGMYKRRGTKSFMGTVNHRKGTRANATCSGCIDDQPHFYSMRINKEKEMSIYLDGERVGKLNNTPYVKGERRANYIGGSPWGTGDAMRNGIIDEVRIYNRALSDDEINALYKAGKKDSGDAAATLPPLQ